MKTNIPESNKLIEDMILDPWNHAVLCDISIKELNQEGFLIEQPLVDHQVQPNSVDLTLGNTWKKILPNKYIHVPLMPNERGILDPRVPVKFTEGIFSTMKDPLNRNNEIEAYMVEPGEFVLMATNEIFNIPPGIICFICGRSSIARLGIQIEQAGLIDAGFRGTITLEVHNQTSLPILLLSGMRIAQAYFIKAQIPETMYGEERGSKYKDQMDATESRSHLDKEFQGGF